MIGSAIILISIFIEISMNLILLSFFFSGGRCERGDRVGFCLCVDAVERFFEAGARECPVISVIAAMTR